MIHAATEERSKMNCVFWNPGPEFPKPAQEQYIAHFGRYGLANTNGMGLVLAVLDPTLTPGVIEANLYARLNLGLPLGKKCQFFAMGDPAICEKVSVKFTRINPSETNPDAPNVDVTRRYLLKAWMEKDLSYVVVDGAHVFRATIQSATPGIMAASTKIIVVQ
jgi:hypothetical protein